MSIPFHCHSELHSMKKNSEDSLKKTFFPKFKLLNSGCGLSAGVYGMWSVRIAILLFPGLLELPFFYPIKGVSKLQLYPILGFRNLNWG